MSEPSDPQLSAGDPETAVASSVREFTIDELAQIARMTVRNVRAYQDKGLIPPPEIRGRTGIYSDAHLARLRMIGPLLARGYSLGNIAELIGAWERGQDLRQLLGLEQAITSPWSEDVPVYYELSELMTAFGRQMTPELLGRAVQLNLVQVDGARFRVPSPRLFNAGLELVAMGVPMMSLLDVLGGLRANVEQVANQLMQLVAHHVLEPLSAGKPSLGSDVPQLADILWRLRPIIDVAVEAEVATAMEKATQRYFGERMDALFQYVVKSKDRSG